MMNLNANLTTLASFDGELEKSNSSIADNYLKAAGICIAAQGGVAFHIVHGKQVPTADTLSIAKILQAQGSQKQSWQPNFGQPKESTASIAVNSHTYFSPEVAPAGSQARRLPAQRWKLKLPSLYPHAGKDLFNGGHQIKRNFTNP